MHLGLISPELTGHLNPMTTLGRELQRRGHRVTVITRPDGRRKAEAAGLGFAAISAEAFPEGALAAEQEALGRLHGLPAIRFTAELLRRGAASVLEGAPEVVAREKIDALVVDQMARAGGSVADKLGLPHVIVCNALAMNSDPQVPAGVLPWSYREGLLGRLRNAAGDVLLSWLGRALNGEVDGWRTRHGLPALPPGLCACSGLAEIAQQPAFFDFPRRALPSNFHYTAPWHDEHSGEPIPFPWEKLDGRPLVYASMGTLQNRLEFTFSTIAAACAGLDVQLVISLGSKGQDAAALAAKFAGTPIVVSFAPQLELLRRAALSITHAGLNTALESLGAGLPMVAIPITNDQPGVASRLEWLGVAEVVQPRRLSVERLRAAIERVLTHPGYREKARRLQEDIHRVQGVARAADIVEKAFATRRPVLRE
ncbi:MAG TPA: glycosyltransferase [Chthoniobacteraceae bacterium]|nr:glycosyltransferase [Chthoniobacteraceae bacterium]